MIFNRVFAMPSADTFSIPPIADFVRRHLLHPSIDPFARNSSLAQFTNDLDPNTTAAWHLDAHAFCLNGVKGGLQFRTALFDPPYSPRQISEVYKSVGLAVGTRETQNGRLYKSVRDALDLLIAPGGKVLSFGWNSSGMGTKRGYEREEVLLVAHGAAHNDTICVAERKMEL